MKRLPEKRTTHCVLRGIPASPGVGKGVAYVQQTGCRSVRRVPIPDDKTDAEVARFDQAVEETRKQLRQTQKLVSSKIDQAHAAIFEAQEVLLDDPLLIDSCRREIRAQKLNAEWILDQVVHQIRRLFEEMDVPHLSTQNLDVLDVTSRIRENLHAEETPEGLESIPENSVIVAHDLRPSDTARLNPKKVVGIITQAGGPTSHSAILAKALQIPAVVGVESLLSHIEPGATMIVDGYKGTVTVAPTRPELDHLEKQFREIEEERESLDKLRTLASETNDGYPVDLAANLELPDEVSGVERTGANGIGLFRSEFFYIGRGYIPSEDEQYQVYRKIIEQVAPLPVICRTLDLGGDKFLSNVGVDASEINTYLGLRAIRLCLANPDIFRSQLRAILRASAFGKTKIMFPFITDISEVRRSRELLETIKKELRKEKTEFDEDIQVGIMIETPAAALTAPQLACEVDFFSIGTNDLIQYTMALDRVNESVADLYDPLHPAVVRLVRETIDAAHKAGIWVGVCGEMAADPALAALLLGLGADSLSMSAVAIPQVKRLIRSISLKEIRELRQDVMGSIERGEAHEAIRRFRKKHVKEHASGLQTKTN